MGNFSHHSSCICCFECDKHQVNQRFGYIIPCSKKNECPAYTELMQETRQARLKETAEKRDINAYHESIRHRVHTPKKK